MPGILNRYTGNPNLPWPTQAPQFGRPKWPGAPTGAAPQLPQPAPQPMAPQGQPGLPGPELPPSEQPQAQGLLSKFLSAPGQNEGLGLLGSYLIAASAPTTDLGQRQRLLAEGLREYVQTLNGARGEPFTLGAGQARYGPGGEKIAERPAQEKEKIIQGADGYNYWATGPKAGQRVLPGIEKAPGKLPEGMRYSDTGEPEPIPGYLGFKQRLAEVTREPTPQYSGKVYVDENVGKYYQVNPKNGKREYISPNDEFLVEATPDGGFRIRKGPPGAAGVTTKTQGDLEAKLLNAREQLVRLREVAAKFRPEFQEIPTRLGAAWTGLKARLGSGEIKGEDRRLLADFADYKRGALANVNLYIKEITGAQMSEAEANRLRQAVPDPGQTIFGGDDPITFESKLNSVLESAEKASVRYRHYLREGITDPDEMAVRAPLDEMEIVVNPNTGERRALIEGQWVPF